MTDLPHTPGPWRVIQTAAEDGSPYIEILCDFPDGTENVICRMGISSGDTWGGYVGEEDDARFIAAAPDTAAERDRLRARVTELEALLQQQSQAAHRAAENAVCVAQPPQSPMLEGLRRCTACGVVWSIWGPSVSQPYGSMSVHSKACVACEPAGPDSAIFERVEIVDLIAQYATRTNTPAASAPCFCGELSGICPRHDKAEAK